MQVSGLFSNIDTAELINSLLAVERKPIKNIEEKKDLLNKKKEIYNDVLNRLKNLKNLASDLSKSSSFNVFNVSYSQSDIVIFNTNSNTIEGKYNITVNNVAKAHTIGSDKQSSSTEALNLNSGTIKINGIDIEISSEDSLTTIRDKINNAQNINVRASIVDNVLRLQSANTGSANQISLVDDNNILIDLGILNNDLTIKNVFLEASDASVTVDGQVITSSSNLISNVFDSGSLEIIKTGSTEIKISKNLASISSKIKSFVDQYNSTIDLIHTKITEKRIYPIKTQSEKYQGLLNGDSMLNNIKSSLNSIIIENVNGLSEDLNELSEIGITKYQYSTTGDNTSMLMGKLKVDDAKLNEALNTNFQGVIDVFTKNYGVENLNPNDYGIAVRLNDYLYNLTKSSDGIFSEKSKSIETEIKMLQDRIDSISKRLELREKALQNKYVNMESAFFSSGNQLNWLQLIISSWR